MVQAMVIIAQLYIVGKDNSNEVPNTCTVLLREVRKYVTRWSGSRSNFLRVIGQRPKADCTQAKGSLKGLEVV
jgi:hypothetical protein